MEKIDTIKSKIISGIELHRVLAHLRFKEKRIVFTNGCFDIIHRGHVEYLAKAASLGDILFIGLNSDISVRKIKGPSRPLQDENARALVMASFLFVSYVVLFEEDTPYDLIKLIQPDILVKGGDYKPEDIVGYDIVKAKNGEVLTIPFIEGFSTTSLVEKMKK